MEQRVLQAEQAWVFQWNPVDYNTFADYHTLKPLPTITVHYYRTLLQPRRIVA